MSAVTIDIGGVLIPRIIDSVSLRRPSQKWQRFVPAKPAGVPNQRTKVGDRAHICYDAHTEKRAPNPTRHVYRVVATCPFRGVRLEGMDWHRSWVRVKGGAA